MPSTSEPDDFITTATRVLKVLGLAMGIALTCIQIAHELGWVSTDPIGTVVRTATDVVSGDGSSGDGSSATPSPSPPPPEVPEVDRNSITFPDQQVNTTSSTETITVNNGGTETAISSVDTSGADAGAFGIDSDECTDQTLAPEDSCTVTVTFTPSEETDYGASLDFSHSADEDPLSVSLSGTGTEDVEVE